MPAEVVLKLEGMESVQLKPDGCLAADLSQLTEARSKSSVLSGLWQTDTDTQRTT
ncbi:MAG: hypothetical protein KAU52_03990 [Methanosarcinales archaeon]|nr:hypothetical protein [Methanosarcinales archaeon]